MNDIGSLYICIDDRGDISSKIGEVYRLISVDDMTGNMPILSCASTITGHTIYVQPKRLKKFTPGTKLERIIYGID